MAIERTLAFDGRIWIATEERVQYSYLSDPDSWHIVMRQADEMQALYDLAEEADDGER